MPSGTAARLAWALTSALAAGLWLRRRQNPGGDQSGGSAPILRIATLALCGLWSALWLFLALIRLPYPFELEWIGGAMRDHCARALAGLSLYVPPGPDWFPYEYPPLYFWISSGITRITHLPLFQAMRLVSIGSTLGCAALLWVWVRRLSGPSRTADFWGMIAAGLFLAAYRMTGAWYDVERLDMLFLFLSLLGIVWLGESLRATALSALALALAFFTKQQAILFIAGGIAALAWRHAWRHAIVFAALSLMACLLPALRLNAATHGWFGYYCFRVPLANGIQWRLARQFFIADLPLYAPAIAILVCALFRPRHAAPGPKERTRGAILAAATAMGALGSLLSRAHWGGDQNVLIAGYLFLGAAACAAAARMEEMHPRAAAPLYALLLAQIVALTYRPDAQLPTGASLQAGRRYVAMIHDLERQGEVLCLDHGGLTSPPHFQIMGLLDVLNTEKRTPPALVAALRAHRFAAIVTDERPTPDGRFYGELLRDYTPEEQLGFRATWVVTGYPTPGPGRPVWILRPEPARTASSLTTRPRSTDR